jgi:putative membrane protein
MVASKLFTSEDLAAVSAAVAEAEKRTAGEIVPVVSTASDRYERAEDTFGIWLGVLAFSAAWLFIPGFRPASADWETSGEVLRGLILVVAVFVGAWIAGVFLASRIPFFKRLAATRSALRRAVEAAAEAAFVSCHVRRTKAATGIVLYVSLFERMVTVQADRAVAEKVDPSEWNAVCDGLLRAMRAGRRREGFVEAIRRCGDLLAKHFPIQPGDVNELSNELRILD